MILFTVCEKEIESGQFPIEHLQVLSKNTGAKIIIGKMAIIENGIIEWSHLKSEVIQ